MTETATPDSDGPSFPMRRQCPFAPPPGYGRLLAEEPVSKVRLAHGDTAWLVTRHTDVRTVLTSPAFSADGTHPGFPVLTPERRILFQHRPFIRTDPPEHSFYRRMLTPEFTVKRVRTLRAGIQATVDALLDDLLEQEPPVDLVEWLALPLPSLVICQLLGVPYTDHDVFQRHARTLVSRSSLQPEYVAALQAFRRYLDQLISTKQQDPGDDLVSRLVTGHLQPAGSLRRTDLVTTCVLLLNAGHETTANMISLGVLALLEHPDQLDLLRSDPELAPDAVEELLRCLSIADFLPERVAVADTELAGTTIRAGEGVLALLAAADHDPAVFPDPGRLDLRRGNRHHLAFGHGVHQCLGQHLARLELEIVFTTLFERIPTLKLATPPEELAYKHEGVLFGVHELPVTWQR